MDSRAIARNPAWRASNGSVQPPVRQRCGGGEALHARLLPAGQDDHQVDVLRRVRVSSPRAAAMCFATNRPAFSGPRLGRRRATPASATAAGTLVDGVDIGAASSIGARLSMTERAGGSSVAP